MRAKNIDDVEIKFRGIEALNKTLGPAGALRFLSMLHRESTDYVEISQKLYEGQTIEEIFERARLHKSGRVDCLGRGPGAPWRKKGITSKRG
jgi:hypothetical protein